MGSAKDEEMRAEDAWARAGKRCGMCHNPVPLSEQDSYFDTGLCGYCRHTVEKDD